MRRHGRDHESTKTLVDVPETGKGAGYHLVNDPSRTIEFDDDAARKVEFLRAPGL